MAFPFRSDANERMHTIANPPQSVCSRAAGVTALRCAPGLGDGLRGRDVPKGWPAEDLRRMHGTVEVLQREQRVVNDLFRDVLRCLGAERSSRNSRQVARRLFGVRTSVDRFALKRLR